MTHYQAATKRDDGELQPPAAPDHHRERTPIMTTRTLAAFALLALLGLGAWSSSHPAAAGNCTTYCHGTNTYRACQTYC
jgi:hypothetical protein